MKGLATIIMGALCLCLISTSGFAVEDVIDCSQEMFIPYFPAPFVKNTLKKFGVPEDQWEAIIKDLATVDQSVVDGVEQKAAQMQPNPLDDTSQHAVAVKLFQEILHDVFTEVMHNHDITDETQIRHMLADIQAQKAKRFRECLKRYSEQGHFG